MLTMFSRFRAVLIAASHCARSTPRPSSGRSGGSIAELGPLDPPVRGSFQDGVGTFYADDTWEGKPIRMRFIWSKITATSCHWEQAFSTDKGVTWETNWVQDIQRAR